MKTNRVMCRWRRAFTLVELLIVISIIALLIGLLLPALGGSKEAARRVVCAQSIHQNLTGFVNYAGDHGGAG